jgi:hypothetical protein
MRVSIHKSEDRGDLCWVEINQREALSLVRSLINQIQDGPNCGRLESRCKGDVKELSIVVIA